MILVSWIWLKRTIQNTYEKNAILLLRNIGWNLYNLHIDKLAFRNLPYYFIIRYEQESQRYNTSYYMKICTEIVHMYCTTKLDTCEGFRYGLSQFLSWMSRNIVQDIQNRGNKIDVWNHPLTLPIYREICEIVYSLPKTEHVFVNGLPYHGIVSYL